MDISLITITPITGDAAERVAIQIVDDDHTTLLDVEDVFALANWLQAYLSDDDEPSTEEDDLVAFDEQLPEEHIDIPEELLRPKRVQARRTVDLDEMVTDGGPPTAFKVVKSPRPAV